jgi:hypothetical protein
VTSIGVTTANGVSGTSSGTSTPSLTIALGAITPSSVACSGNVTAYYSDERLKENIKPIEHALDKLEEIRGVTFNSNSLAGSFGYKDKKRQVGVIAQEVQKVQPEVVVPAPFDTDHYGESLSGEHYMTVQYDRLVPLLIEAIKELSAKVARLEK